MDDVEAVFNFDVPQDDEYYVHRIGRTGRAFGIVAENSTVCRSSGMYSSTVSISSRNPILSISSASSSTGYFAEGLHGDMKQMQRDRVMNHFRNGNTEILVATDVAARGIDVDDVEAG